MEYTEEVKTEADSIFNWYNTNTVLSFRKCVICAIQDRQSVLDKLNVMMNKGLIKISDGLTECDSLAQQIEYLKSKL